MKRLWLSVALCNNLKVIRGWLVGLLFKLKMEAMTAEVCGGRACVNVRCQD